MPPREQFSLVRPEVLLLDVGGVVIRTPFELHRGFEIAAGLDPGTLDWLGPHDPTGDPLWRSLLAGDITERGYWDRRVGEIAELTGDRGLTMQQYCRVAYGQDETAIVRPEALETIDLAESLGVRFAILTNDLHAFHGADWVDSISVFSRADPLIDCGRLGVLKPDPGAYAAALERLGCQPDGVLFVDDQPANVAAAREAGIPTIEFDVTDPVGSFAQVTAILREAG